MADAEKKPEKKTAQKSQGPAAKGKPAPKARKQASGGKLLALLVGVVVVAFVIAIVGYDYFSKYSPGGETAQSSGPSVGGPFTLTGPGGKTVSDKDYRGKYMMIYFGYTYCPDVCPTSLTDMADALNTLPKEKSDKIQPIFISVDPARDSPDHLAEYVKYFYPRLIGLTGTQDQIKKVAKEFRVYYRINKPEGDDPMDYVVDHTSIIYLVGPDGKLVTHFSHGTTPEAMAERLGKLL